MLRQVEWGGKLRKEQKGDTDNKSTNSGEKKKGMSRGLFGRKKDKKDGSKTMSFLNPFVPRPSHIPSTTTSNTKQQTSFCGFHLAPRY